MSNTAKTIIGIVILVIIVIIIASATSNNTNVIRVATTTPDMNTTATSTATSTTATSTTSTPAAHNYTVTYTTSGFSPSSITINTGDTVQFMNNSSGTMWVASDPHPTHTDLSAFDARRAVPAGQSWSYTFTTPGTHPYHNHTNSQMKGVVIVK